MAAVSSQTVVQNSYFSRKASFEAKDGGRPRFKVGCITLPATADNGDTATFDVFDKFGIVRIIAVLGWIHTTANSVIVEEAPTTAYDGTLLTLTVGGATANKQRCYVVYGI